MPERIHEKLARKEKLVEKRDRMLEHDFSSERATLEEVFDQATLMVIYDFLNSGLLYEMHGVVNAGKEARVYWGKDKDGKDVAVKIYLTTSAEFRKGMLKYIEGDYRFKGVKRDTRSLIFAWAQKEYKNLEQAYQAKVRVPKPIAVKDNVLLMEFIGKNGVNAPSLKEQPPSNPEEVYKLLLTYVKRLYSKAELVHGDLSEYNLMMWKGKPVLFDMAQAVPTSHPMAQFFLNRDLANINRFFSRLGVSVLPINEVYNQVVS
ncbi:MAG: serine protein kinase RIO [Candidatus Bathyarchaeota archaeon]|nr:serine protein kinase RIO [Candidatus Bathyarchaeota archaeon]